MLSPGKSIPYKLRSGRHGWVQVASGSVSVNGKTLAQGDGAAISEEAELTFTGEGSGETEFLFFDLA